MNEDITIKLSHDEALVLFEFFARFQERDDFTMRHTAEFVAFSRVAAQLDTKLVEPFDPDYLQLVRAARERLTAGHEGAAPGVSHDD